MSKSRFEAFSDGVFAIAITLLILEIHIPEIKEPTNRAIVAYIATLGNPLLAYVVSFATIGTIWVNHHRTFLDIATVDANMLFLNLLLLLTVCVLPLPTELIGRYGIMPASAQLMSASFLAMGLAYGALWFYTLRRHRKTPGARAIWYAQSGTLAYLVATLIAPHVPVAATAIDALVALYYCLPGRVDIKPA